MRPRYLAAGAGGGITVGVVGLVVAVIGIGALDATLAGVGAVVAVAGLLAVAAVAAAAAIAGYSRTRLLLQQSDEAHRRLVGIGRATGTHLPGRPVPLRHAVHRDVAALLSLHGRLAPSAEHVPLTDYSALPGTALVLAQLVSELPERATVVELGSGATTLWMALAARQRGGEVRIVSLDHEAEWGDATRTAIARNGVDGLVDIRVADLQPMQTAEGTQNWYAPSTWDDVTAIDLLFIDGPPGGTGPMARYPALEALADRLRPGAYVVLDDVDRDDEAAIVERWAGATAGGRAIRPVERRERTAILRVDA